MIDKYTREQKNIGGVCRSIWQDIEMHRLEKNYKLYYVKSETDLPVLTLNFDNFFDQRDKNE